MPNLFRGPAVCESAGGQTSWSFSLVICHSGASPSPDVGTGHPGDCTGSGQRQGESAHLEAECQAQSAQVRQSIQGRSPHQGMWGRASSTGWGSGEDKWDPDPVGPPGLGVRAPGAWLSAGRSCCPDPRSMPPPQTPVTPGGWRLPRPRENVDRQGPARCDLGCAQEVLEGLGQGKGAVPCKNNTHCSFLILGVLHSHGRKFGSY